MVTISPISKTPASAAKSIFDLMARRSGCPVVAFCSLTDRHWKTRFAVKPARRRRSLWTHQVRFQLCGPGSTTAAQLGIDVSPDNRWLVKVGQDRAVRVQDTRRFRLQHFLNEHDDVVWSCDFSPDSQRLATGSQREGRGEIVIWSSGDWKVLRRIYMGTRLISGLQFHPELPLLAACSFDGSACLVNYESGEMVCQLLPAGTATMDVKFSPDGRFLAAANTSEWRFHLAAGPCGRPAGRWPGSAPGTRRRSCLGR